MVISTKCVCFEWGNCYDDRNEYKRQGGAAFAYCYVDCGDGL